MIDGCVIRPQNSVSKTQGTLHGSVYNLAFENKHL